MSSKNAIQPLEGITIVEAIGPDAPVALTISASMCGKIARDLGANVIRIITPDSAKEPSEVRAFLNVNKRTLEVGSDAFLKETLVVAKGADCIIADINTHEALIDGNIKSSIVALGMSIDNPLGGTDFTLAAQAGLLDLVGEPHQQPLRIGGNQIPYSGGLACYAALIDMLTNAQEEGDTQSRRVDLLDVAVWLNWKAIGAASLGLPVPTRQGSKGMWCVIPCKDGFLALVYRSGDWAKLINVLGDERLADQKFSTDPLRRKNQAELNAIFEECFSHLTRAEIRKIALEQKLPLGSVLSLDELIQDEHMKFRDFFQQVSTDMGQALVPKLPVKWNENAFISDAHTSNRLDAQEVLSGLKPFSGCRVLDLGIITAGGATTAILADLGADVIKIEGPNNPDPFRYWDGPLPEGSEPNVPPYFRMTNRGKRNLALDLKTRHGREIFLDMVRKSDVIVENFRRGVLDRWDLGFEVLKEANPDIILASISSQGEKGPDSQYVSFGNSLEAMAGLASITGYKNGPPIVTGSDFNFPDQVVAIFASSMIQTAWLSKERGGGAVQLDLSQRELTTFLCGDAMIGRRTKRVGNSQAGVYFQECFKSASGDWVAISLQKEGLDKLAQEDCDGSPSQIEHWIAKHQTDYILRALAKYGIAAAKVMTGADVLEQRLKTWSRAISTGPDGLLVKGVLFDSPQRPLSLDMPAGQVGARSAEVLKEFTGLTGDTLAALLEQLGASHSKAA